ncbi:phosphatidylinositol N-acetylglucosaminyltransferase subunit Q [Thrips palmi]|uniref:Phosphatidylinositol N-acetylglucosaminyltransferase subunit Q n=1 Tax=Thrips palmi TaxID=161013 RepID=A0A6P8ZWC7_THRPL|nr:phosphatidylinositol N-acetylglucosaminyltransferase subunit Q [Thrips palmi]
MAKHLVFLPCSIAENKCGALYGIVKETKCEKNISVCYFILNVVTSSDQDKEHDDDHILIGESVDDDQSLLLNIWIPCSKKSKNNAIQIRLVDDHFQTSFTANVEQTDASAVIIVYDEDVFRYSELLRTDEHGNGHDQFQVLGALIQEQSKSNTYKFWGCFRFLCTVLLAISNLVLNIVSLAKPVFQYSALWVRFHGFLSSLSWALGSLKSEKKVSLKVGNYIIATAVDICAGILLLNFINYIGFTTPLSDYVLSIAKEVVHSLQYLLQWLSGSPAGLKLNGPFNLMMGRFFMYHIKLWWIFLSVAQPLLELLFSIFLILGKLGVTFQAAILEDLLFLVSFHIYCIYVYAARVYYLQLSGLQSLWRLFLGRKHNPLRERVDSCQYSPDQLFVGTLTFTIILFLLPTTLMYYVVFTTMRLVLLSLSGTLTQACFVFHALPVFATIHWLCRSNRVTKSIYVTSKSTSKNSSIVLFVTPVADSWWNTVKCCLPDTVQRPSTVNFGQLVHKLMVGELVYPVDIDWNS